MWHVHLFESNTNHAFHCIWGILLHIHEGNIFLFHFTTSCISLVQELLFLFHSHYNRAKTGLRPRFYLNCSHLIRCDGLGYARASALKSIPAFSRKQTCGKGKISFLSYTEYLLSTEWKRILKISLNCLHSKLHFYIFL